MRPSELAERLVIGASHAMSLYCYSVLRLDPYVGCGHGCIYCFTRLLPGYRGLPRAVPGYPRALDKVLSALRGTPVLDMPFRMSALTDPLQPLEEKARASLGVLEAAHRWKIPILLSTKSCLTARNPWLDLVKDLAGEGRLVAQVTIITLDPKKARVLEPGAPSPEERLRAVETLASEGVPVVVRLQPLIPFVNDSSEDLDELLEQARAAGARQVIAEYYRFASWRDLELLAKAISPGALRALTRKALWEKYPTGTHKRPKKAYRLAKYKLVRHLADKHGLLFSTCREGLYELHTAPNCCGIHFMRNYRLRPTLKEYLLGPNDPLYVSREELASVPVTALRKKILEHYDYLERYVAKELKSQSRINSINEIG